MTRWWVLTCSGLLGCSQILDPCPSGSEALRGEDRCLELGQTQEPHAPEPDAGLDAQTDDTGVAPVAPSPEAGTDAGAEADAGDASAPTCSDDDVAAWRGFHEQQGVVAVALECLAEGCEDESCPAAECVRSAAGLEACTACSYEEALCVVERCPSACGEPGSDLECRACVCEAGCVARFDACAGAQLDVCDDVYGRDVISEQEYAVTGDWLLRAKSATGLFQAAPLAPYPPYSSEYAFTAHFSKGFTQLLSFRLAGRSYLLQHKSRCGNDPCVARISPLLSDGSLGRPVYVEEWTRGWDELELFTVSGQSFLLRYKTDPEFAQGEPVGSLRIDRLVLDEAAEQLTLEPALTQSTALGTAPWSSFESFVLGERSYLLRYGSARGGEVQLLRASVVDGQLALTQVSGALSWSLGWDVVEMFVHQEQPYLLAYKSGRMPLNEEPAGTLRIMSFFAGSEDTLSLTPAIYEGSWEDDLDQITRYEHAGVAYLLAQNSTSGAVSVQELPAAAASWQADLGVVGWSATWGADPVWDMLEIVRGSAP